MKETVERAHTGNLGAREALVGAGASEVGEGLWAPRGGFEGGAVEGGRGVLPNGGIGERERVRCKVARIGEGPARVHRRQRRRGRIGPVDRAVLLKLGENRTSRTVRHGGTDLGSSGDGDDRTQVDTGVLDAVEDELDGVEPHADGRGDLAVVGAAEGAIVRAVGGEVAVKVDGRLVDDGGVRVEEDGLELLGGEVEAEEEGHWCR